MDATPLGRPVPVKRGRLAGTGDGAGPGERGAKLAWRDRTAPVGSARRALAGTAVRITLTEWRLDMSADTVPAGRVSFLVTNQGIDRHELEVEREDEEFDFGEIPAGAQQQFAADLKPGVYEVYCPLADPTASHKSRGMIARLVVR